MADKTCPACFQLSTGDECGSCGRSHADAVRVVQRQLGWYIFGLVSGLLAVFWTMHLYTPLDHEWCFYLALALVMTALLLIQHIQNMARLGRSSIGLYRVLAVLSLGNVGIAAMLLMNGALDRSVAKMQPAIVTRRWTSYGRASTGYHLELASWRTGRKVEQFQVSHLVFERFGAGDTVWVELHDGFLGLPWASGISSR